MDVWLLVLMFTIGFVSTLIIITCFLEEKTSDRERATIGILMFLFIYIFTILYMLGMR
ncbi:MAG: hypothetical protein LBH88_00705 [Candidatus Methanoplasma sp.]|jgi:hypothetical protein|nr:hypothetical protein [Candidatus Methanoplasma sp.]